MRNLVQRILAELEQLNGNKAFDYEVDRILSSLNKILNEIPEKYWNFNDKGEIELNFPVQTEKYDRMSIKLKLSKEELELLKSLAEGKNFKISSKEKLGEISKFSIFDTNCLNTEMYPNDWWFIFSSVVGLEAAEELITDEKGLVYLALTNGERYPLKGIYSRLISSEKGFVNNRNGGIYYDGIIGVAMSDYEKDYTYIGTFNGEEIHIPVTLYPYDMGNGIDFKMPQAHIEFEYEEYEDYDVDDIDEIWQGVWEKHPNYHYNDYINIKNMIVEADGGSGIMKLYTEYGVYEIPYIPVVKPYEMVKISEILFRYEYLEKKYQMPFNKLLGFYKYY